MQSTKFAAALGARVDGILDVALTEQRVVGAVFLLARDGAVVCERAVGHAERETQRPMRTDTLFRLSSITKPYVSAAALALIARGQLSLDDRVDKWLPEFQPRLAAGAAAPITVHQLLTHTAGLGYGCGVAVLPGDRCPRRSDGARRRQTVAADRRRARGMVDSAPDTLRFLECMRKGGTPILPAELARAAMTNQIGALAGPMPGFGFGYGGAVLAGSAGRSSTAGAWHVAVGRRVRRWRE